MKSDLEILIEARKLISKPEKWIKGDYARDAFGDGLSNDVSSGVCFCGVGAVAYVAHSHPGDAEKSSAVKILEAEVGSSFFGDFNDNHNHADVLRAFDQAIANLQPISGAPSSPPEQAVATPSHGTAAGEAAIGNASDASPLSSPDNLKIKA